MKDNRRLLLVLAFLGAAILVFMFLNTRKKTQQGQQAADNGSGLAQQQAQYYGVPPSLGVGGNAATTAWLNGMSQGQTSNFVPDYSAYDALYTSQQLQYPLPMNG